MGDMLDLFDLVGKKVFVHLVPLNPLYYLIDDNVCLLFQVKQTERNPVIPVVTQQSLHKEANDTADTTKTSSSLLSGCSSTLTVCTSTNLRGGSSSQSSANFSVGASTSLIGGSSSQSFQNCTKDSDAMNGNSASDHSSDDGMDKVK